MSKQTINVGTTANDGTGSTIRAGGQIINANFTELYAALGDGADLQFSVSGVSNGQGLIYNSSNSQFEPGAILTATGTDTLENKTFDLGDNTLTGTTAEFNTALQDGSFATLAGSESITNKTFDTSNTFPTISIRDESSTSVSVGLGGNFSILGTGGVNTSLNGSEMSISISSLDATSIADGSVSNTEFQYLNGVSSNIQTQIDAISGGLTSIAASIALG
jgi:hypothetical protein